MSRKIYGTALKVSLGIYWICSVMSGLYRYSECHSVCDIARFNNTLDKRVFNEGYSECDNATCECYQSCKTYNMLLLRDMYDDLLRQIILGIAIVNYRAIHPNIVRYQIVRDTTLAVDQIFLRMEYGHDGLYYFPKLVQKIMHQTGIDATPAVCWSLAGGILSLGCIMILLSYKASSKKREGGIWTDASVSPSSLIADDGEVDVKKDR
uniref:Uncharacterized protein n=1 Tax=Penaeus semisulcatus majanivirus TaxID=2984274 RepID=A0A9C7C828_9VIRU|nr:MAG: hypothetical protein [Penaeus semisulcatus majanivirus]